MLTHALSLLALSVPVVQDAEKPAEQKPAEAKPSVEVLERALEAAHRKAALADLDRAVGDLRAEEELRRAVLGREDKEHAAEAAERDLGLYEEFEAPASIAAAVLAVDRSRSRLISERQDLEGILRIYAEEEEAQAKDEIIRRHRVAVEFAERGLQAAEEAHEKTQAEVAAGKDKRRWALEKAGREADLAGMAVDRAELGVQVAKLKAEDALAKAEAEVAEAKRKLETRRAEQGE